MVTADVNPWCSSNWQQLRYKVLRPGEDPRHSQVLLDEIPSAYKDIDDVIEQAKSLIAVRHTLRQFVNVKGD